MTMLAHISSLFVFPSPVSHIPRRGGVKYRHEKNIKKYRNKDPIIGWTGNYYYCYRYLKTCFFKGFLSFFKVDSRFLKFKEDFLYCR